jgi:hypothetical protein
MKIFEALETINHGKPIAPNDSWLTTLEDIWLTWGAASAIAPHRRELGYVS